MFGMGFTEILIIAVIAILFLGPDKLPTAMVEVAKFFQNAKNTLSTVKDSIEEEMNVKDLKEEALAYKKELLEAGDKIKSAADIRTMAAELTTLDDNEWEDDGFFDESSEKKVIKETQQTSSGIDKTTSTITKKSDEPQEVTFEKKPKRKSDKIDV